MAENDSLMLEAGINAIALSGLAAWRAAPELAFEANEKKAFEDGLDSGPGWYGRWLRWSWFAIGAETLAKAACLANSDKCAAFKSIGKTERYYLPDKGLVESNLVEWARAFRNDGKAERFKNNIIVRSYDSYGELSSYWQTHLPKLGEACSFCHEKIDVLCAGYRLLAGAVRNRDLHNYVLGVRQEHFYLVKTVFVPSFNILLETFPRRLLTGIEVRRHTDPT